MKIADIHTQKNGRKKVDFFHLGIYETIRTKLNFRYKAIEEKGYYFEEKNGLYTKTSFIRLKDAFANYIKNHFNELEINGEIEYEDFLNAYYQKSPIKNGQFPKIYLSENFELTDDELHQFKMENDFKYRFQFERKAMEEFIEGESFIETKNTFGNFFNKNGHIYIKKAKHNNYLLLYYPEWNSKKNSPTYDLFKTQAENEKELFTKRDKEIETIMLGFKLNRDIHLYNDEK